MVEAIGEVAKGHGINVFRRFAFMKSLHKVEKISFDRMVDQTDIDRLHQSDWVTSRVTWALKLAITNAKNADETSKAYE